MTTLSNGSIDLIIEHRELNLRPIVQLLVSKIMSNNNHIRAVIFDGKTVCQQCIFVSTEIDRLYNEGKLENFTIIRLEHYSISSIPKRNNIPVILVNQIQILRKGNEINRKLEQNESIESKMENQPTLKEDDASSIPNQSTNEQAIISSCGSSFSKQNNIVIDRDKSDIRPESVCSINFLTPFFNSWIIRGLCIHKSQIRNFNNSRGGGRLFNFDLCDNTGEIHITCFNEECDRFFDVVDENRYYFVGRGMIKTANKRFSSINNDYEITLTKSSFIKLCEETDIKAPKLRYKFIPLEKIIDMSVNTLVDVIGVIRLVDNLKTVMNKKTSLKISKRDIAIVDKSMVQVRLTLWDHKAKNFLGRPDQIIALKGVVVDDYKGKLLSVRDSTHILIDPNLPEKEVLKIWHESLGPGDSFKYLSNPNVEINNDNFIPTNQRYISSVTPSSIRVGQTLNFQTIATVIGFNPIEYHMYKSCAKCPKKVIENGDNTFECLKCNEKSTHYQWRMIVKLKLADQSGSFLATIFNDQIEMMFKKSVSELATLIQSDTNQYGKILNEILFNQFTFNIHSRIDYYNGEMRLRHTIAQVKQLKSKNHPFYLLELIKRMDK